MKPKDLWRCAMRSVLVLTIMVLLSGIALAQQQAGSQKTLAQLISDGYEIKAVVMGGATIVQKGTSAFVCEMKNPNPQQPAGPLMGASGCSPIAGK
jgi:hypothetical protein